MNIFIHLLLLFFLLCGISSADTAKKVTKVEVKSFMAFKILKISNALEFIAVGGSNNGVDSKPTNSDGSYDAVVARISLDGMIKWSTIIGKAGDQIAVLLVCDETSNEFYVIGHTSNGFDGEPDWVNQGTKVFIVKVDADGNRKWTKIIGMPGSTVAAAAFNPKRKKLVISMMYGKLSPALVAFDTDGTMIVMKGSAAYVTCLVYDGEADEFLAGGLAFSKVAGQTPSNPNGEGFIGFVSYTAEITGVSLLGSNILPMALTCADTCDTFYASGAAVDDRYNDQKVDIHFAKYSRNGKQIWIKNWGGKGVDFSTEIAYAKSTKAVILAGSTDDKLDGYDNKGQDDSFIAIYTTDGDRKTVEFFGTENIDVVTSIAIDQNDGTIYTMVNEFKDMNTFTKSLLVSIKNYFDSSSSNPSPPSPPSPTDPSLPSSSKIPTADNDNDVGKSKEKSGSSLSSGIGTFFLVLLVLGALGGSGYFAYMKYTRGSGRTGYIHLPLSPQSPLSENVDEPGESFV